MTALPASYIESRRYATATIQHQHAEHPAPCSLQPRDVAIVNDVRRYRFLTFPQLLELWWPDSASPRTAQHRLRKLHEAGLLDRFRPLASRGSYPWTFQLAPLGHQLLQRAGHVEPRRRFNRRAIYDFSYVVHDLQLNSWVLAYRRDLRELLLAWDGESEIAPPAKIRVGQLRLDGNWIADGLPDARPRMLRPDGALTVASDAGGDESRVILIEYDRTRRVDKNFEKFRRYDSFLTWWWRHSGYGHREEPPFVLFVCQDEEQRDLFLDAADRQLTGRVWHPNSALADHVYPARRHLMFAAELDAHEGVHRAMRVPSWPPGHPLREAALRNVRLPGGD